MSFKLIIINYSVKLLKSKNYSSLSVVTKDGLVPLVIFASLLTRATPSMDTAQSQEAVSANQDGVEVTAVAVSISTFYGPPSMSTQYPTPLSLLHKCESILISDVRANKFKSRLLIQAIHSCTGELHRFVESSRSPVLLTSREHLREWRNLPEQQSR